MSISKTVSTVNIIPIKVVTEIGTIQIHFSFDFLPTLTHLKIRYFLTYFNLECAAIFDVSTGWLPPDKLFYKLPKWF